jgi:ribonuclease PH
MLLLVLLCLSSVLYSEVCLTDAEFTELEGNLSDLDRILTEQAQQIQQLQALLTVSNNQIAQAKNSYSEAVIYWQKQRLVAAITAGSLGLCAGIISMIFIGGMMK